MNKQVFTTNTSLPQATAVNEAGGAAYSLSSKETLAQYATTGMFDNTFYASGEAQLERFQLLLEDLSLVPRDFIAKTAIYSWEKAFMKDASVLLCAALTKTKYFEEVFDRVITNPKQLMNFVRIIRSGVVGRKSFGSRVKRKINEFLTERSPYSFFLLDVGNANPTLADVMRMTHPKLSDSSQAEVAKYLMDKPYDFSKLPERLQALITFRKGGGELPDVPFNLLTSGGLTDEQWNVLGKRLTYNQLRQSLNNLTKKGFFTKADNLQHAASVLSDAENIKRAKVFPYGLYTAFMNMTSDVPTAIKLALQDSIDVACENIPQIGTQPILMIDTSGSMGGQIHPKGQATCFDAASLFAAAFLRKNPLTRVIGFSTHAREITGLNPRDSVVTLISQIRRVADFGGTDCSVALRFARQRAINGDVVIFLSDNESWVDSRYSYPGGPYEAHTRMMAEWDTYRQACGGKKLVCINMLPYGTVQVPNRKDTLNIGGMSDNVFAVAEAFVNDRTSFVDTIENSVTLLTQ